MKRVHGGRLNLMLKNNHPQRFNSASQILYRVVIYLVCILVALICLFPFLALLIIVTKSSVQITSGFSFRLGTSFFDNIKELFKFMDKRHYSVFKAFLNSCIISFSSTALCIYFSALTAYACHVYDFKGKAFFEKFILFLIIIPGQLGAVGFFRIVMNLHLDNTYIPFIFPAIASASTVYFLRQYLRSNFSKEYVDAARMDGANEFAIFNMICLPYIKAGLATMALFGIITSWNSFMGPMTFITDAEWFTLPQLMFYLTKSNIPNYGAYYVGILITMLPMLVIYFFMSKTIMKGVSAGGIK